MIHNIAQPGDIGLVKIRGIVGWLLRILQWINGDGFSKYTHSFIYLGNGLLIEGQPGGARIIPVTEYADRDVLYVSPPNLTFCDRQWICSIARTFEHVPYSFLDYAALGAHRFRMPIPGLRAYIASTGHMICSQLCAAAYDKAGIDVTRPDRWVGYVTPGRLYKEWAQQG